VFRLWRPSSTARLTLPENSPDGAAADRTPAHFGFTPRDLVCLAWHFAGKLAPARLRADAASEFIVGAFQAAALADPARKPRSYIIAGGVLALRRMLWHESFPLGSRRLRVLSLDAPGLAADAEAATLLDATADPRAARPEARLADRDFRRLALRGLADALADLAPRERAILRARLGYRRTFQSIGRSMGLSRERIRQIVAVATDRLRVSLLRRHPELAALCAQAGLRDGLTRRQADRDRRARAEAAGYIDRPTGT